jgi:hypothetical protein
VLVPRMGAETEVCPRCGSRALRRLVSRFAFARGYEARLERLVDDATLAGVDEDDPKSVARFMRRMGQELSEDAGEDFQQALEEVEQEQAASSPEALEGA